MVLKQALSNFRTEWVAVVPKGHRIPDPLLESRGFRTTTNTSGRLFKQYELPIEDEVLNDIAERILTRKAGLP
jgi:hypothetical protein